MFKKLFGRTTFRRFPDSFTLTRAKKMETLCQWVQQQSASGERVIVLSHFKSSFLENQTALQDTGIEFDILAEPLNADPFTQWLKREQEPGSVLLTMSQMLKATEQHELQSSQPPRERPPRLSVIVTERYPLITQDRELETFFQQTDTIVLMGYLISFDDPILVHLLGQRFVDLMKQLGLGDNELISSTMTHRGLSRKLQKATYAIQREQLAESPEEWIELNLAGISGQ